MKKVLLSIAALVFLIQACASPSPAPTTEPALTDAPVSTTEAAVKEDTASRLERLGGYPCPDSDFTCIDVTVPLNHFDSSDKRTMDVVFAVLPASGERKGMFVTVIGGPGGSGLLSADSYTSYFDPSLPENFDIVFFDQRGINASSGLFCAQAAADFYRTDTDATTPESEAQLQLVTKKFVDACIAEIGETDLLPYLDTVQAVEDLEAFRVLMEDEKFWLYGESYGTQFAQTYAASHPDRIAGLILDGVVDLTLTDIEFLKGQAAAFNDVLVATLEACNADETCANDMGRDALAVYDELAAQLKLAPIPFEFPLSSGQFESREFTFADLEATSGFLYSETARSIFLRALASYSRDNTLVPLARVVYSSLVLDPDTQAAIVDPSYSDAVYYGVTCRDYAEPGNSPEEQAANFIKEGDEIDASVPRLASVFYGDMPCVYWPYPQEDDARPEPFTGGEYPTFVLNGTADPATPYSNAEAVYSNLTNGYFITETGASHVIFGWGVECVDSLVTDFLVNDALPTEREITCEGSVTDEAYPVMPADASEYESVLQLFELLDYEIFFLPDYYYWDYETPTTIGCTFGGTLSFAATDTGESFKFENCAFSKGFVMTGTGESIYDDGSLTIEVDVTGLKDGTLTYVRTGDLTFHVTGTYGGEPIDLSK
jgi:pimeloyl-ACP methyl ester carboxylesterase